MKYQSVACVYSFAGNEVKSVSQSLMTVTIDQDLARFAQIQFGDDKLQIQYQVLLENDAKTEGHINVLQNLLVGETENSVEFSQAAPASAEISQGAHAVRCELRKAP